MYDAITLTSADVYIVFDLIYNRDEALPVLEQVATQQVFRPWEVSEQIPRLRTELSMIPETTRLIELLHKVAYHNGLGYSLYSPKRQLGKLSTEHVRYVAHL